MSDRRSYSRQDVERAAELGAMKLSDRVDCPVTLVMVSYARQDAMMQFDEERGAALGLTGEQLGGTHAGR